MSHQMRQRAMLRRNWVMNSYSLLFYSLVVPLMGIAYKLLPVCAFISLLLLACQHGRAPYFNFIAKSFALWIYSCWPQLDLIGFTPPLSDQTCFLVDNVRALKAVHTDAFSQELLAWSLLIKAMQASDKPIAILTEMPSICNAPVIRLWFQMIGFIDYRAQSVTSVLERGYHVLVFDSVLAKLQLQKVKRAIPIVHCSVAAQVKSS